MGIDEFHQNIQQFKNQTVDINGKSLSLKDFIAYKNAGMGGRAWLWIKSALSPSSVLITKKSIEKAASQFSSKKKHYFAGYSRLDNNFESLDNKDKIQKKVVKDHRFLEKVDRVFQSLIQPPGAGSLVLTNWLVKSDNVYFAHATNNYKKILDEGVLKPSEMLLREGKLVEFELGTTGARGKTERIVLSEEDVQSIINTRLTVKERERLNELEQKVDKAKCKELSHELKSIQAKLANPHEDDDQYELLKRAHEIAKNPLFKEYVELRTLQRYQRGFLFTLQNKARFAIGFALGGKHNPESTYNERIRELCKKYDCTPKEILIALDEVVGSEEKIDAYLAKKYTKGYPRGVLYDARQFHLQHNKLNPEIRMSENTIFWGYGDVVILKKKDSALVGKTEGLEAVLKAPWENKEEFLVLDLKNDPDLIILGPRKLLEQYEETYPGKCAYIEDLNAEQLERFNVPKDLR